MGADERAGELNAQSLAAVPKNRFRALPAMTKAHVTRTAAIRHPAVYPIPG